MTVTRPESTHLRQQAFALLDQQRHLEAETVFAQGAAAFPGDAALAFGLAQTRYELGKPAAALFGRAVELSPERPEVLRNHALALISEGRGDDARGLLAARLAADPDWLDGHKALATLNWTSGDRVHFADHLAPACRARPANAALWLAWFSNLAQARQWSEALCVLDEAERHLGSTPALLTSRLFAACEMQDQTAERMIETTAGLEGITVSLCRVRHYLRTGRGRDAEAEALRFINTPSAPLFWPYLSLAWRLADDPRHQWLDRPEVTIRSVKVDLSSAELAELAEVLRGLHVMRHPYI
ncbi:MAG: tetratricopeptide repeat protein [Proteobacteria bacterium]|nr:tetratricopeptide repeat protein [Pseudomonadota bacterium]